MYKDQKIDFLLNKDENVYRLAPSEELLEKEGDKERKFIIHGKILSIVECSSE